MVVQEPELSTRRKQYCPCFVCWSFEKLRTYQLLCFIEVSVFVYFSKGRNGELNIGVRRTHQIQRILHSDREYMHVYAEYVNWRPCTIGDAQNNVNWVQVTCFV